MAGETPNQSAAVAAVVAAGSTGATPENLAGAAQGTSPSANSTPSPAPAAPTMRPSMLDDALAGDPNAAPPAGTPSQAEGEKLLAGKFKTPADLEKGYSELEKKLGQGTHKVPETYALDVALKEAGIEPLDPTTNKEVYAQYDSRLKEANLSTEQLGKLLPLYKEALTAAAQEMAKQYGPQTDLTAERAKLESAWGAEFTRRHDALKAAASNYPQPVVKALAQTSEGMQWFYDLVAKQSGPIPMRGNDAGPIGDPMQLDKELRSILTSKEYQRNDTFAVTKANQLIQAKLKAQGR